MASFLEIWQVYIKGAQKLERSRYRTDGLRVDLYCQVCVDPFLNSRTDVEPLSLNPTWNAFFEFEIDEELYYQQSLPPPPPPPIQLEQTSLSEQRESQQHPEPQPRESQPLDFLPILVVTLFDQSGSLGVVTIDLKTLAASSQEDFSGLCLPIVSPSGESVGELSLAAQFSKQPRSNVIRSFFDLTSQNPPSMVELPNDDEIPPYEKPIIMFFNGKSGGNQGFYLLSKFREKLSDSQVFDILSRGPQHGLEKFKNVPDLRVIVCGGDGTGRWVLETIDKIMHAHVSNNKAYVPPVVGILPLGTGNDLGRVFGWGGSYNNESLESIIEAYLQANRVPLDRWAVAITEEGQNNGETKQNQVVMNNYLSLGFADAKISLQFHQKRENNPSLFCHRTVNKLWYLNYGAKTAIEDAIGKNAPLLSNLLQIEINDKLVQIPNEVENIVVLNVPSYAGGMNLWGKIYDPKYRPASFSDGLVEVIGISGALHLGKIGAGLSEGIRLGQGNKIKIRYTKSTVPLPGKIDGEPWEQKESAVFEISFYNQVQMLSKNNTPACYYGCRICGWLLKKRLYKKWKSRWVVVQQGKLITFRSRVDTSTRTILSLSEFRMNIVSYHSHHVCIEFTNIADNLPDSTHTFSCGETNQDPNLWIEACRAEGLRN